MTKRHEYRFKIDGLTLDTLPMARLAEYMSDLAIMLGARDNVYFVGLEKGSVVLVHAVENDIAPQVRERMGSVSRGTGPSDAMKAFQETNKRLKHDNSVGMLSASDGAEIIQFPGRELEEPVTFGPFNQEGTLDGKVIMVGGKSDPVPVHIEQEQGIYNCQAKRDIASALGRYLFQSELRVRGTGRWTRDSGGAWVLNRFTIESFEVLDKEPLSAVVAKLRDVPGNDWRNMDDPWSELTEMRQYDDETH